LVPAFPQALFSAFDVDRSKCQGVWHNLRLSHMLSQAICKHQVSTTCKGPYACTHATIGFRRWQRGQRRSGERQERGGRTVPSQPRNMQVPSTSPKTGESCCPERLSKTFNNHVRRRSSVLRGDIQVNHMATRNPTPDLRKYCKFTLVGAAPLGGSPQANFGYLQVGKGRPKHEE